VWIEYALAAAILTSLLPIINKILLRDTGVWVVAWTFNALSLPLLAVAAFLLSPNTEVSASFWLGVLGSGILNLCATLVSTQALQHGEASRVTPFLTFNPVFTLLVSIFTLREIPSLKGVLGVAFIALGAYLFAIEEVRSGLVAPVSALLRQTDVLMAIFASFIWGLTPIFEKVAIQNSTPENPPLVAFWSTAILSILLLPLLLWRSRKPFRQIVERRYGFLTAAIIAGVAPLFGFTAIALGPVGYVTALFKLSSVFTVILAYFLLKEGAAKRRILASGVMVAGAIVLAL
jgi:uncharacterized membrane protein